MTPAMVSGHDPRKLDSAGACSSVLLPTWYPPGIQEPPAESGAQDGAAAAVARQPILWSLAYKEEPAAPPLMRSPGVSSAM